jgi:hypothetical protein
VAGDDAWPRIRRQRRARVSRPPRRFMGRQQVSRSPMESEPPPEHHLMTPTRLFAVSSRGSFITGAVAKDSRLAQYGKHVEDGHAERSQPAGKGLQRADQGGAGR